MDLTIIIPCYNEAENAVKIESEFLPVVVKLGCKYSVEVIFVDDGSTDDTWTIFRQAFDHRLDLPAEVKFLQHPQNLGLGAALRTGFAAARGDLVITTDSDGTYKFAEIPSLLAGLTPKIDVVTASPYHPAGGVAGVPAYRIILSQGASILYRLLVDWHIHTYTCLVRAYRREVIKEIAFDADGFLAGTELMVKAILRGYKVVEYPAILHQRTFGVSKAKLARTILAHLRFQGRILLHRLHLTQLDSSEKIKERPHWA